MTFLITTYAIVAFASLVALSLMILRIGTLMATCPINGPAIKISALSIATAFAAIGAGGITLIAAGLIVFADAHILALAGCLGLASLCLGLGFTQAVATLRVVVDQLLNPRAPQTDPEPRNEPLAPEALA